MAVNVFGILVWWLFVFYTKKIFLERSIMIYGLLCNKSKSNNCSITVFYSGDRFEIVETIMKWRKQERARKNLKKNSLN